MRRICNVQKLFVTKQHLNNLHNTFSSEVIFERIELCFITVANFAPFEYIFKLYIHENVEMFLARVSQILELILRNLLKLDCFSCI